MSFRKLISLSLMTCLTFAGIGRTFADEGWGATFATPAVASQLPAGDASIIVVAVGAPGGAQDRAADALTAALRASQRAQVVLDDASLGTVGEIGDAEVIARCEKLPVIYVAVVRSVDGAAGETPRALVSIYDKKGALVVAFVARSGVAIDGAGASGAASVTASSAPGAGVAPEAMKSVESIQEGAKQERRSASETYAEKEVGYEEVVGPTGAIGRPHFFLGPYRKPLEGEAFYRAVGRDDLARQYASKNAARVGLVVGGTVAMVGGTLYMLAGTSDGGCSLDDTADQGDFGACVDRQQADFDSHMKWGLGIGLVGSVAMMIGYYIDPQPVDATTQRQLAGEHNSALKAQLGVGDQARAGSATRVRVNPYVQSGGGGVSVALTF